MSAAAPVWPFVERSWRLRSARHEPDVPGAVTFSGSSDLVVHQAAERCPRTWPHDLRECEEFDWGTT